MSTWRRKAIKLFPDLREVFEDPDSTPYTVFIELKPRCLVAHARKDDDELGKIYGFATWCSRQQAKDLWNSAGVVFYEHIVDCDDAPGEPLSQPLPEPASEEPPQMQEKIVSHEA